MSQFDQYTFTRPKEQQPIVAVLSEKWDKTTKLAVTMVAMRRLVLRPMGIKGNPVKVTIAADQIGYAAILELANTSSEHVAKFEAQGAQAKLNRRGRKLLAQAAALLQG